MSKHSISNTGNSDTSKHVFVQVRRIALAGLIALTVMAGGMGCQTAENARIEQWKGSAAAAAGDTNAVPSEVIRLHEGDAVRIVFPGAPNLNTDQQIRRDGRITLQSIGETKVVGLTPGELEKELIKLYGAQLQVKEVNVTVTSSVFFVYITGAVLRPGKITADRPINALEAIMEAGGFDYAKANVKAVTVLRQEDGKSRHYSLNLKRVLSGQDSEQFMLQRSDIIYVAERFTWF